VVVTDTTGFTLLKFVRVRPTLTGVDPLSVTSAAVDTELIASAADGACAPLAAVTV
jgi:hypothetical protein